MKLHYARFCPDCYEVFSNKGTLRPENSCPSCANRQTISVFNLFSKRFLIQEKGIGTERICGRDKEGNEVEISVKPQK